MGDPNSEDGPKCVSKVGAGDNYNLSLHIVALFLVLLFSILGAGFPVAAKRLTFVRIPEWAFFFCKHFGTGVLLATAFAHLLPTAFTALSNPCLPPVFARFPPFPGILALASLLSLFALELWMNKNLGCHAHSHGGPTGIVTEPKQKNSPPLQMKRYDTASDLEKGEIEDETPTSPRSPGKAVQPNLMIEIPVGHSGSPPLSSSPGIEGPSEAQLYAEYRRKSLEIMLLEGGILFHSIFVGISISLTTGAAFISLLIAILFHQTFEGLGLGSRIAAVPERVGKAATWFTKARPWFMVFAFGITAPIGQAIGLIAREKYDPQSAAALGLMGVCNSISAGLLIYASLVDLLYADLLSPEADAALSGKQKLLAFGYILLGVLGMSIVGGFA